MSYRKNYLLSHDVDWFRCYGDKWIHAASRGGFLPSDVDDEKVLPRLQALTSNLRDISDKKDVTINEEFIKVRYDRAIRIFTRDQANPEEIIQFINFDDFRANYIESFVEMACKGFYSYARINIDDPTDKSYCLIAKPIEEAANILCENINFIPNLLDKDLIHYIDSIKRVENIELDFDNHIAW